MIDFGWADALRVLLINALDFLKSSTRPFLLPYSAVQDLILLSQKHFSSDLVLRPIGKRCIAGMCWWSRLISCRAKLLVQCICGHGFWWRIGCYSQPLIDVAQWHCDRWIIHSLEFFASGTNPFRADVCLVQSRRWIAPGYSTTGVRFCLPVWFFYLPICRNSNHGRNQ